MLGLFTEGTVGRAVGWRRWGMWIQNSTEQAVFERLVYIQVQIPKSDTNESGTQWGGLG